jgi:hypothetical protein
LASNESVATLGCAQDASGAAAEAALYLASLRAAVASGLVSVVALLGSGDGAITAHHYDLDAELARSWASVARLNFAEVVAAVVRTQGLVVAFFGACLEAVTTEGNLLARLSDSWAVPTGLQSTCVAAAVATDSVADRTCVFALLVARDSLVAARNGGNAGSTFKGTEKEGVDLGALVATAVPTEGVPVIADLRTVHYSIGAVDVRDAHATGAVPVWLYLASAVAAVTGKTVPIVALFPVDVDLSVAAAWSSGYELLVTSFRGVVSKARVVPLPA